jgi:hypothetical protein
LQIANNEQRRQHITLQDDPSFDPMSAIPRLDLLRLDGDLNLIFQSQYSSQNASQVTPLASQQSGSSAKPSSHFSINLPESSLSAGSYRLPPDLGLHSPAWMKQPQEHTAMDGYHPFLDDDVPPTGVTLEIDGDGNIIGFLDEQPELPHLPGHGGHEVHAFQQRPLDTGEEQPHTHQEDGGHGVFIMGEQPLPDAQPFPSRPQLRQGSSSSTPTLESSEDHYAIARNKRRRRPKKHNTMLDQTARISREVFRSWTENYVSNMDKLHDRAKVTSAAQAKKNAQALLYGNGIADVGVPVTMDIGGLIHPLAEDFAGKVLRAHLLGRDIDDDVLDTAPKRGRRRGRSEAFAED